MGSKYNTIDIDQKVNINCQIFFIIFSFNASVIHFKYFIQHLQDIKIRKRNIIFRNNNKVFEGSIFCEKSPIVSPMNFYGRLFREEILIFKHSNLCENKL